MEYTWLIVLTIIVMVTAVIWTVKIGVSLNNKEVDRSYSIHTGRKWGRLIALYIVVIAVVIAIFMALMNK